jgi:uncharacterized protein (DUF433 family)
MHLLVGADDVAELARQTVWRYTVIMNDRIEIDPAVHFGQPCVRGTRIPVHCVLELIEDGISFDRIIAEFYPSLSLEDIKACVHYAVALSRGVETHVGEAA